LQNLTESALLCTLCSLCQACMARLSSSVVSLPSMIRMLPNKSDAHSIIAVHAYRPLFIPTRRKAWMENDDKTSRMNGQGDLPCNYYAIKGSNRSRCDIANNLSLSPSLLN